MKPYPHYKPTGLAWLPSVPEHWEVVPFKQLFTLGKGLPITKADLVESGTPVVSYGQIHSKTNTGTALSGDLLRFVPPETAAAKPTARLRKGDFAFADTSEDVAGCGNCVFNNRDDEVFGGYHTILAFNHRPEHGRYLSYLFQSPCWRDQIRRFANGVKVYSVTGRILNAAMVTLPDSSEQDRIVRYLDEKTAAIDELVRAKERQIELLRERKQALVSAAVTGGLGPATERKDSGVPWIGKIPKGWEVRRGKFLYRIVNGFPFPSEHFSVVKGYPLIRIRDITSGQCETFFDGDFVPEVAVVDGDLLVGMDGDFGVRLWQGGEALLNQRCCMVKEFSSVSRQYLFYTLPLALKDINDKAYATTVKHLSSPDLLHLSLPLPPLPEQQRIVAHLDSVCSELDAAEAAIRKQISLLQELRTRLVSDAVTGAVEVG